MTTLRNKLVVLATLAALFAAGSLAAGEIILKSSADIAGNVVMLSDVADIRADDAREQARLTAVDLSPAPGVGGTLSLRAREIQDILALRGFSEKELPVTGANRVTIKVVAAKTALRRSSPPLAETQVQGAEKKVRDGIAKYLKTLPKGGDVGVKLTLSKDQARLVATSTQIEVTAGGKAPFAGSQSFEINCYRTLGDQSIRITAELSPPPSFVVAARPIAKGTILKATDLKMQPGQVSPGATMPFATIADAVGKESARNITTGQIIDDAVLQRPVLVHKGHVVRVYSLAEGVTIETKGRARDDGAAGDIVSVETIAERKPYFAKVSNEDEVEVYAQLATTSTQRSR